MQNSLRHSDTISRQGGDEFVVLLPNVEHAKDAAISAEKMLAAQMRPHHIGPHKLHISVSIGISVYPDDGQDTETLIKCADIAMYHAKERGRNKYKFYKHEMNMRIVERQSIEAELRLALERQEFVCTTSPSFTFSPARSSVSRHLFAGNIPNAGSCHQSSSCPSPKTVA